MEMFLDKFLACVLIIVSVSAYECPCGWDRIYDTCYYFSDTKLTWADARANCLERGGDLAVPANMWENNAIFQKLKSKSMGSAWLGVVRIWNLDFYSICGVEVSYTNWDKGEPNNLNSSENCVEVLDPSQNKFALMSWNDQDCNNVLHYVCERHHPRCLV